MSENIYRTMTQKRLILFIPSIEGGGVEKNLFIISNYLKDKIKKISIISISNKFKNLSQNIAHFGFSLFILSILFNNFLSTEVITNLKVGETFKSKKFEINFEKIEQKNMQNYLDIITNHRNGMNNHIAYLIKNTR